MLMELFEWLKSVVVFVVICEMILSFAPSHAFKKYIKPFAGLLILLRITVFLMGQGTEILKLDVDDFWKNEKISLTEVVNPDSPIKEMLKENHQENEIVKEIQKIQINIEDIQIN